MEKKIIENKDENGNVINVTYIIPVGNYYNRKGLLSRLMDKFKKKVKLPYVDEKTGRIFIDGSKFSEDYWLPAKSMSELQITKSNTMMTDKESELIIHKNMYCD